MQLSPLNSIDNITMITRSFASWNNLQCVSKGRLFTYLFLKFLSNQPFDFCCIKYFLFTGIDRPSSSGINTAMHTIWSVLGSGGIEKSHSCKWAKWIQWHALPHIQQSTQQRNKGYYPNLHGWDFSIPPSPKHPQKYSLFIAFTVLWPIGIWKPASD